ncbi:MAG: hypothetical protein WA152_01355 [Microgenomates group bacterium]
MRKEVLFAIIAGISIGLILAFGAWKVSQMIKRPSISQSDKKNIPPQNKIDLSISNLFDYDIITDSPYILSGISKPKTAIVTSTIEADFYSLSNDDGSFEVEVDLPAGLSELLINGKKFSVVYSSEFEKYLNLDQEPEETDATESAETKNAADLIRERLKQEVSSKSLKKTAYVGTITDISSGNIQIKSVQGDIKQMSLNEDTSYINTLKKNAEIKSTDLAIGDYIVAMGFVNGNKVLDSKRILIAEPAVKNNFETIFGTIDTISKTKLVINRDNGEVIEITLPKKWVGPNVSELEEGQRIITIGEMKEEIYSLRTIFTPVD